MRESEMERICVTIEPEARKYLDCWSIANDVSRSKAISDLIFIKLQTDEEQIRKQIDILEKEKEMSTQKYEQQKKLIESKIAECIDQLTYIQELTEAQEFERKILLRIADNHPNWFTNREYFEMWIQSERTTIYKCGFKSIDEAYEYVCQNIPEPIVHEDKIPEYRIEFINLFSESGWVDNKEGFLSWTETEEGKELLEKCKLSNDDAYELGTWCGGKKT